jgi:hypothetical protein
VGESLKFFHTVGEALIDAGYVKPLGPVTIGKLQVVDCKESQSAGLDPAFDPGFRKPERFKDGQEVRMLWRLIREVTKQFTVNCLKVRGLAERIA